MTNLLSLKAIQNNARRKIIHNNGLEFYRVRMGINDLPKIRFEKTSNNALEKINSGVTRIKRKSDYQSMLQNQDYETQSIRINSNNNIAADG